ncbi:MAG: helix-turn-helix transcriptional regulator [Ramlibacter sp.]|nr:helix-turn-helix transcriptional regulator [Ramlibacter sp.]
MDPRLALGLRIKELRSDHGLTQEELAERSGMFRTYMSRVESGAANPTLTMLYQIAGAFGLDVRELLTPGASTNVARRVKSKVPTPSRGRVRR